MWRELFLNPVNFSEYRNFGNKAPNARSLVFYDEACPFCRTEMHRLRKLDTHQRLEQIDISEAGFNAERWGVEAAELDRALHVLTGDGIWLVGMPAVRHIYNEVGL